MFVSERWLPVPDWEMYEVSDLGRVRRNGRILKQLLNNRGGYPIVQLKDAPRRKCMCVHRLMADAFLGGLPKGMCVCHRDDDPTNNVLTNLYIGTYKQNFDDSVSNGRRNRTYLDMSECRNRHCIAECGLYTYPDGRHQCRGCIRMYAERKKASFAKAL